MAFPKRAPVVLSWLWPQVLVVTFQYSAKHFKQCLHMQWSVQHGEGAVPEGVGQAPDAFAFRGLAWSNDDRGGGRIQSAKQFQDPEAALGVEGRSIGGTGCSGLDGDLEIHDGDMDGIGLDQLGCLFS